MPPSIRALPAFPPKLVRRTQRDCFVSYEVKQDLMLLGSNRKQLSDKARLMEAEREATDPDAEPQAPREPPASKTLLDIFCTFFGHVLVDDH